MTMKLEFKISKDFWWDEKTLKDLKSNNGGLITEWYNFILTDVVHIEQTAGLEQL
jgi:hypothetical protein